MLKSDLFHTISSLLIPSTLFYERSKGYRKISNCKYTWEILNFNKVYMRTRRRSSLLMSKFALEKLFRYLINCEGGLDRIDFFEITIFESLPKFQIVNIPGTDKKLLNFRSRFCII